MELHIQSRVADELKRLEARESQRLKELEEQIAREPPRSEGLGAVTGHDGAQLEQRRQQQLDQAHIQREVAALRQRLQERKRRLDLDPGVKRAKDDVVTCLRTNDRRPLDCWREVEAFKREVARLEDAFVEKSLH